MHECILLSFVLFMVSCHVIKYCYPLFLLCVWYVFLAVVTDINNVVKYTYFDTGIELWIAINDPV